MIFQRHGCVGCLTQDLTWRVIRMMIRVRRPTITNLRKGVLTFQSEATTSVRMQGWGLLPLILMDPELLLLVLND
jgi:hypothetical protein